MSFLGPLFPIVDELEEQAGDYHGVRLIFAEVTQDRDSSGWSSLGDFSINVSIDGAVLTDVPIPNPNPSSGGVRPKAAATGDTVMCLQLADGNVICLGRVDV